MGGEFVRAACRWADRFLFQLLSHLFHLTCHLLQPGILFPESRHQPNSR